MHEAQGVDAVGKAGAGPALLPGQRPILVDSSDLDAIEIHVQQSAVGVLQVLQGELAACEGDLGVAAGYVGVVQAAVVGPAPV